MFKAVVFDVDGVLVDSDEAIYRIRKKALSDEGLPVPPRDEILAHNGLTTEPWLRAVAPSATREQIKRMARWTTRNYYNNYLPRHAKPMPGMRETIEWLHARGAKLAIVTNQTRREARASCALVTCREFAVVVARTDVSRPKPHPEGLKRALRELGVKPGEALYVGDTVTDLRAGEAAGVFTVILHHGRNAALRGHRVDSPAGLKKFFEKAR